MPSTVISRRSFLVVAGGAAAGVVLGACGRGDPEAVGPSSEEVGRRERERRRAGSRVQDVSLVAGMATLDLAGRAVQTWAYGGSVPGPEVRLRAGDVLRARLENRLPEGTTVHWHGIVLRNDMDGVPDVTQELIEPGRDFIYEFVVPEPGTFFFHPHAGLQLDRGLYAPLVVEDPEEPGRYDREMVVMLDDWTDGVGEAPDAILARLRKQGMVGMGRMGNEGGMGGMGNEGGMGGTGAGAGGLRRSEALGGDPGDVVYPLYLLNGRPPESPATFEAKPGERIRLRLVNAGGDTAFRVALGGHRLEVTHSDGFPVRPVTVDAILLGMGERYDAVVTVGDGVFPLVAAAEGKAGQALGVVRTGSGTAPGPDVRPQELDGRLLGLADLAPVPGVGLPAGKPDRVHRVVLGMDEDGYRWTINDRTFGDHAPLDVRSGQRVRLEFENRTPMFHPMHLHGHTFQVQGTSGAGPRKDTVIVRPMERLSIDLVADNPGQWALHCHNVYHQEAGMMTTLSYEQD